MGIGYPLGTVVGLVILIATWAAFGWVYDKTMGHPPWFGKRNR